MGGTKYALNRVHICVPYYLGRIAVGLRRWLVKEGYEIPLALCPSRGALDPRLTKPSSMARKWRKLFHTTVLDRSVSRSPREGLRLSSADHLSANCYPAARGRGDHS